MPAGNLTDEDLKHILTLLGSSAQDEALRSKIEGDLPAPAVTDVKLGLTADGTGVQVLALPPGCVADFAQATAATGAAVEYPGTLKGEKLGAIVKPTNATHPFLDAHAVNDSTGDSVGVWFSQTAGGKRLQVKTPEPAPEPPAPGPAAVGYHAGACMGGWSRPQEVADAKKLSGKPIVRLENPSDTKSFTEAGVGVIYLNSGGTSTNLPVPHLSDEARAHRTAVMRGHYTNLDQAVERFGYSSGGVKSLNTATVVAYASAVVNKHPGIAVYEYLNEPGGSWFWGSGAESQENATAYAKQGRAIADKLLAEHGANAPLVALSFDGGHAGDNAWGRKMLAADPTLFQHPLIVPTNHPYDGSAANPSSTLVHWGSCEETHRLTGKWPLITEYGRPLMASTGDSPKSTEEQQAKADGAMAKKCAEVGTIYTAYGYKGDSSPCYAVFKGDGTARPAVAAIHAA